MLQKPWQLTLQAYLAAWHSCSGERGDKASKLPTKVQANFCFVSMRGCFKAHVLCMTKRLVTSKDSVRASLYISSSYCEGWGTASFLNDPSSFAWSYSHRFAPTYMPTLSHGAI